MEQERNCPKCGQMIPLGETRCPRCEARRGPLWSLGRESLLLLSLLFLVLMFVVTGFTAKLYHAKREQLAQDWFARGEKALSAGRSEPALEDFRTALVYSPENPLYQLRLAQALVSGNRVDEARPYLLNLAERDPQSGPVNVELGRLAARQGDVTATVRYLHNAIYGVWGRQPEEQRRALRLELFNFLQSRGSRGQAEAELIALADETPEDAASQTQVGNLFMGLKDYDHAIKEFRRALRLNSKFQAALAGAGQAEFQTGDYRDAEAHLARAVREKPRDTLSAHLLEMANLVLAIDPFEPRLKVEERSRRTAQAFDQAMARLESCAKARGEALEPAQPQSDLETAYLGARKMQAQVRQPILNRHPDAIVGVMDFVFEMEAVATRSCGAPAGLDEAIALVGQRHGGTE